MCLVTSQYEPYIAPIDIPVVKVLSTSEYGTLETVYTHTPVLPNKLLYAKGSWVIDKDRLTQNLGSGLIHAYIRRCYARFCDSQIMIFNLKFVEAYIPKGTKFFISVDHETIAAEKLYISSNVASNESGLADDKLFKLIRDCNMEPKPKKPIDDHDRLDPGHKIGLLILSFIFMLFVTRACAQTAQYDTAIVKYQNIERIVSQTTDKGAVRYYAVYNDKQENISELIPVSKTVLSYINACKQNQIEPSLAIRLKNGIIVGLIRYKTKYIVKRKR